MSGLAITRSEPETQNPNLSLNGGPTVEKTKLVLPGLELNKEFTASLRDHPERPYGEFLQASGFQGEALGRPISQEKYEQIRKEAANAAQIAALTKAVQTLAAEVSQLKQQRGEVTPIPAQFTAAPSHAAEKATEVKPAAVVTATPVEAKQHPIASPDQTLQGTYTVKANETLSSIGAKLGHRYQDIAQWNNIEDANRIKVGQVLRLTPEQPSHDAVAAGPQSPASVATTGTGPVAPVVVATSVQNPVKTETISSTSTPDQVKETRTGATDPKAENTKASTAPVKDDASGVSVHGQANLAVSTKGTDVNPSNGLESVNSRLTFGYTEKVTEDLTVFGQLETKVGLDNPANSGPLGGRDTYLGLKYKGHTLTGGNQNTLIKGLRGNEVPGLGDMDFNRLVLDGQGTQEKTKDRFSLDFRQPDGAQYVSPKIGNTTLKFSYSAAEGNTPVGTPKIDSTGLSVEYNDGTWNAGYAYLNLSNANGLNADGSGKDLTGHKAIFGWQSDKLKLGAGVSFIDNDAGRSTVNEVIAATYKLDSKFTLKGTLGQTSESGPGARDGFLAAGVEIDYALSKNAILYGNFLNINNDSNGVAGPAESSNAVKSLPGEAVNKLSVGVNYKF